MKYLRLASVAALVGAAAVSASPLGARGDDTCPKGYTASVYYKTIYFESSTTATPIESTVIPSPTPVVVSSQVSAIEQVQTSTSSSIESAVEASSTKAAQLVALLPTSSVEVVAAVETTSAPQIQTLVQQTTTQAAAETTTAPVVQAIVQQTTSTASTAETTAAPVVQAISEQTASTTEAAAATTTAAAVVKVPQATSSSSSSNSGEATFYGGNVSGGTCSFSGYSLPSTLFGTALSLDRWDSSANCGRCVSVTGPKGNTVKAMIVDQCPECESNHLDLFQDAFAELSDISAGIIDINWSYVSCDLDGPLKLKNKEGTSANWFSMQVVNANDAVTALEVSTDGGSTWQSTTRATYNFFENSSGFGSDTVDVRVTGASGTKVVVKNVTVSGGVEVTASSNL